MHFPIDFCAHWAYNKDIVKREKQPRGGNKNEGDRKQIKWVEDIIRDARETIRRNIELIKALQEKHGYDVRQDELEAYEKCSESLEKVFASTENASDIIEMRNRISGRAINEMVNRYCLIQKNKEMKAMEGK